MLRARWWWCTSLTPALRSLKFEASLDYRASSRIAKATQRIPVLARWWWRTPLISALGRHRQVDLCKFEASLVYRVSSRTFRAVTERNLVSKVKERERERECKKKLDILPHPLFSPSTFRLLRMTLDGFTPHLICHQVR